MRLNFSIFSFESKMKAYFPINLNLSIFIIIVLFKGLNIKQKVRKEFKI